MNDDSNTPVTLMEEPITDSEMNAMSADDVAARLTAYRAHINEGGKLSKTAHDNAFRLLRQLRHRAVVSNPRASKAAKEKAKPQGALDLSQFGV